MKGRKNPTVWAMPLEFTVDNPGDYPDNPGDYAEHTGNYPGKF